jgi:hypothetical protein
MIINEGHDCFISSTIASNLPMNSIFRYVSFVISLIYSEYLVKIKLESYR